MRQIGSRSQNELSRRSNMLKRQLRQMRDVKFAVSDM
jgi:hypothetical protein